MNRLRNPIFRKLVVLTMAAAQPLAVFAQTFQHRVLVEGLIVTGSPGDSGTGPSGNAGAGASGGGQVLGQGSLSTNSLTYLAQLVGTESEGKTVALSNVGTAPLTLQSAITTGPYSSSSNCGSTLAVGATCNYLVKFTPVASGAQTGRLTISTDAGPVILTLQGEGLVDAQATLSGEIDFGAIDANTVSAQISATLTNSGGMAMTISSVQTTTHFPSSHNCPVQLAPGASCSANIRFSPITYGDVTGTVTFATNVGNKSVSLKGTGLGGTATASTDGLVFPDTLVDHTSAGQMVQMHNPGNAKTPVGLPLISGPFTVVNTCSSELNPNFDLNPGGTCHFTVRFHPTELGPQTGTLTIPVDGPAISIPLSGVARQRIAATNKGSLTFGGVYVGASSAPQDIVLSNNGNMPVTVEAFTTTGPYASTHNCGALPAVLAAGDSCTVQTTFSPTVMGAPAGAGHLYIQTDAALGGVTLSGTGLQANSHLSPSDLLQFGSVPAGTTAHRTVTLSNSGNVPLTVGAASVTGDFVIATRGCPATLQPGDYCSYDVTFSPDGSNSAEGTFSVTTSAKDLSVSLGGQGTQAQATVGQALVELGTVQVGGTTAVASLELVNTGNAVLSFPSAATIAAPFVATTSCGPTLAAGATCIFNLSASPTTSGTKYELLTIPTSMGTKQVAVTVVAASPSVSVQGATSLGVNLPPLTNSGNHFSIVNNGYGPVTVTANPSYNGDATVYYDPTHGCTKDKVLAPGASCSLFGYINKPAGTYSGNLVVPTTAGTKTIAITGTVTSGLTATSADFGTLQEGTSKEATVTVTNSAKYTTYGVNVTASAPVSILSNTCGATLAPAATCTVSLRYSPSAPGPVPANLVSLSSYYTEVDDQTVVYPANLAGGTVTTYVDLQGTSQSASISMFNAAVASYTNPINSDSGDRVAVQNNGLGPVTITGMSYTATAGNFMAWGVALPGQVNGYCATGQVLQPGEHCGYWAQGENSVGGTAAGTVTINTSAGSVTYTRSYTMVGLAFTGTTGATIPNNAGVAEIYSMTVTNPTSYTFHMPMFQVYGGLQNLGRFFGSGSSDFSVTGTTCSGPLLPGASCLIKISAAANSSVGLHSASFIINGSYQQKGGNENGPWYPGAWLKNMGVATADIFVNPPVAVSYTATAPAAASSTGTITFQPQIIGSTSAAQSMSISNAGSVAVSLGAITTQSSNYVVTHNCGNVINVGGICVVNVQFKPTAASELVDTLTIPTGAGTKTVTLVGVGLSAYPSASLNSFYPPAANLTVPYSSNSTYSATFRNTGNSNLTINDLGTTEYGWVYVDGGDSCYVGRVMAPGAVCWVLTGVNSVLLGTYSTSVYVGFAGGIQVSKTYSMTIRSLDISVSGNNPSTAGTATMTVNLTNNTPGNFLFQAQDLATMASADSLSFANMAGPGTFTVLSTTCPSGTPLAANGGSCSYTVRYAASATKGPAAVTARIAGVFEFQDLWDGNSITNSGRYRGNRIDMSAITLQATSQ